MDTQMDTRMDTKNKCAEDVCLHAENISKVYPGTKALDQVSFDVYKGKVNVLIGENGAGKSTLMKIIAGIEQPTQGVMYMGDSLLQIKNTADAAKHGIGIIHQELSLFPNLNIYQNVFMAKEKRRGRFALDNQSHMELTKKILERLEHPISVETLVGDLRVGQQQIVEIARNLIADDLRILIMDEPTSSLSQQEVKILFKIMRELLAEGISIVYISHRLEEIMEIGDYVTILRDGKFVATEKVKNIDVPWIVKQMTGEGKSYPKKDRAIDWDERKVAMSIRDLTLPKSGGGYLLDHVSFDLKEGEILGISLSSLKSYVRGIFVDEKLEGQKVDEQIKDIRIKVADKKLPILSLSGGNQQKVVIGKGILTQPKILLLDEPSRGIDIGAKTEVFDIINQYAERGLSIIVISSELKEIVAIADRVVVLSNGLKTAELSGEEIREESLALASYKGHHTQAQTEGV